MRVKVLAPVIGVMLAGISGGSALALETRSYVLSWIVPAMYAHDGDCNATEPVVDPGHTAVEGMYRRILFRLGKSAEEIEALMKTEAGVDELIDRGRVDGKPVNAYQNPESTPDPELNTVVGKYAMGFNLDGKGEDEPGSFEDPYTHEKGIDNQYYRVSGCIRATRVVAPERSSLWEGIFSHNIEHAPAVLISITGDDLSKDGDVVITFDRSIERTRNDASYKPRRDMTFRADPNPLTHAVLSGRIRDGVVLVEGGHLRMEGLFVTSPFDIENTHLRLKMRPDGTLDGMMGGYHPWEAVYHFIYGKFGFNLESNFGIDIAGMYHALKRQADADPDPVTGQNRRISTAYVIQAVPAFVVRSDTTVASRPMDAATDSDVAPLATPKGVTIQIPAGGVRRFLANSYRARSSDLQYFADARGMALYTYDNDQLGIPTCYDACVQEWPPFIARRGARPVGEWNLVTRRDGNKQWTYQGKPLYRHAKDTVVGEVTGAPRPLDPTEEEEADTGKKAEVPRLWTLAKYKPTEFPRPQEIRITEVVDANGEAMVDIHNNLLYTFHGDRGRDNASCSMTPCVSDWIPFAAGRMSNAVGNFSLIKRKDGITQWAYKGKGLYRYRLDIAPGNAKGIGVDKRWRPALVKQFFLPPKVHIRETFGRGKVLTDENGMTLYHRTATNVKGLARSVLVYPEEGRTIGTRSCDAQCMKTWIPFDAPVDAQPSGFWDVVTREDGGHQWSYKGYALYRYAGDKKPGNTNGSLLHEVLLNPALGTASAESQVVANIKNSNNIALIWSHMYP